METRARSWIAVIAVQVCCKHLGIVDFEVEPSTSCLGNPFSIPPPVSSIGISAIPATQV